MIGDHWVRELGGFMEIRWRFPPEPIGIASRPNPYPPFTNYGVASSEYCAAARSLASASSAPYTPAT